MKKPSHKIEPAKFGSESIIPLSDDEKPSREIQHNVRTIIDAHFDAIVKEIKQRYAIPDDNPHHVGFFDDEYYRDRLTNAREDMVAVLSDFVEASQQL